MSRDGPRALNVEPAQRPPAMSSTFPDPTPSLWAFPTVAKFSMRLRRHFAGSERFSTPGGVGKAPVLPVRRHGCRRRRARLLQTATRRGSCASTTLVSTSDAGDNWIHFGGSRADFSASHDGKLLRFAVTRTELFPLDSDQFVYAGPGIWLTGGKLCLVAERKYYPPSILCSLKKDTLER